MAEPEYIHTLIATIGGQPQVVTFTLDLLLQQGIPISEVIVVHLATANNLRLARSIEMVKNEFRADRYINGQNIHFRQYILRHNGLPLDEITDAASADSVLNSLHQLIRDLKEHHCIVHFSISGGRLLLSFSSMSAAILNFTHEDHMWHIYTPPLLLENANEGAILHVAPEDGVQLIRVPLALLSESVHEQLSATQPPEDDPPPSARDLIRRQEELAESKEHTKFDYVIKSLTPRQLEVLKAFAQGLHPTEVAARLSISLPTVSTHTTVLLALCREAWSIKTKERLDYRFIQMKFGKYLKN
jgi:CRISPR-associated protein Csx14